MLRVGRKSVMSVSDSREGGKNHPGSGFGLKKGNDLSRENSAAWGGGKKNISSVTLSVTEGQA